MSVLDLPLDELFADDLFAEETKPEKVRIRVGSPEYFEWIGKAATKVKEAAKAVVSKIKLPPVKSVTCECCGGSGVYKNDRYSRTCFRCRGEGVIDTVQANRNAEYDRRRAAGQLDRHYSQYDNEGWNFAA